LTNRRRRLSQWPYPFGSIANSQAAISFESLYQPLNSSWFSWPCSFRLFNLNRYDLNMQPLPAVRVSSRYGYLCQLLRCFCPCLQVRLGFHCSPPALRQPAFKFVFVFIAFLLSHYLKAVLRPIADTLNSIAEDCLESVVLNGPFTDWVPRPKRQNFACNPADSI